jgi:hypothetical protein
VVNVKFVEVTNVVMTGTEVTVFVEIIVVGIIA